MAQQKVAISTYFKTLTDTGSFEGYAATFSNVDNGGDVILPGAFKEMHKKKNGQVVMLYQHNQRDPIGLADVRQDKTGLEFRGQLLLEVPSGRTAYSLIKAEVLDSMSMGFDVLPGGSRVRDDGVRELSKLKLWEISPVTFAMNESSRISAVKAGEIIASPRALEDLLRDAGGLSHSQAKAIVAAGWRALSTTRDEDATDAESKAAAIEAIRNAARGSSVEDLTNTLKGLFP